ncbi:ubiquitin ligase (cullin) of SCF [Tieghemiomyces parasiticus]|uniref:Cullin-5 n=1 Tax=Tieghemiomyces parasiticus TaxID=78921 RepID=A0A9W8DQ12_9FUNG|nr:ubiquitin ligase (cullin) of SCF [Tieghemiomyces parasiticus]
MSFLRPPPARNFAETWSHLEAGLDHIFVATQNGSTYGGFMDLYTTVYNHLTQTYQTGLNTETQGTPNSPYDVMRTQTNRLGSELYGALKHYLRKRLTALAQAAALKQGTDLLAYYSQEWRAYDGSTRFIDRVFRYMNRYWVRRQREEGHADIYDVRTLCLALWAECVFTPVADRLTVAAMDLITEQRSGTVVPSDYVRDLAQSLVSVGIGDGQPDKINYEVYKTQFERRYLDSTRTYYTDASGRYRADHSVVAYLLQVEAWLTAEETWCHEYLPSVTEQPLREALNTVLISEPVACLNAEFLPLLRVEATDDLARMFRLLVRLDKGLDPLLVPFREHVAAVGQEAVAALLASVGGTEEAVEPRAYTDTLLGVHRRFETLVNDTFQNNSAFVVELDNACTDFINRNVVCKPGGAVRSPELLARYADALLRRGAGKPPAAGEVTAASGEDAGKQREARLKDLMTVFKYIDDKDVFQKYYAKMLAKRLVNGTSASEEAEGSMIVMLKVACGHEYTFKLQRMFTDINLSRELMEGFEEHTRADPPPFKFHMLVLGTAAWPLTAPTTAFRVPDDVVPAYQKFERYYDTQHSGRKLNWLFQHSKAELRMRLGVGGAGGGKAGNEYILQVSTFQMGILLLYNDRDVLTFGELQQRTDLTPETLRNALAHLVKSRLLLASEASRAPTSVEDVEDSGGVDLDAGRRYTLNREVKFKKVRVNLNLPVKSEQRQETEATNKNIAEDRKMLIQAAIVRIMKAKQSLEHVELMNEVIAELKSRYRPSIPEIKKGIDVMLEREYIERGDKTNVLKYVA